MIYIIALVLWLGVVFWITRVRKTKTETTHLYDWEVHGL